MKFEDGFFLFFTALSGILIYDYLAQRGLTKIISFNFTSPRSTESPVIKETNMPNQSVSVYRIQNGDPNLTLESTNPQPGKMGTIATYKVPRHTKITLRPTDYFVFTVKDTGGSALADTTPWQLVATDPNGIKTEIIANGIYGECSTVGDLTKRFNIGVLRDILDDYLLLLQVSTDTVTADASSAKILLSALRTADI